LLKAKLHVHKAKLTVHKVARQRKFDPLPQQFAKVSSLQNGMYASLRRNMQTFLSRMKKSLSVLLKKCSGIANTGKGEVFRMGGFVQLVVIKG
jgi:hypothetical protein